jgi:hypothetical protein
MICGIVIDFEWIWSDEGMSAARTLTPEADTASPLAAGRPERAVIVVSDLLGAGQGANAAALLTLTLGARMPQLPGPALVDADGVTHPGLYPAGLPVLRAGDDALRALHRRASAADGVAVIALPSVAQTTTDYETFRAAVANTATEDLAPVAVLVCGPAKPIRSLTGSFGLMR